MIYPFLSGNGIFRLVELFGTCRLNYRKFFELLNLLHYQYSIFQPTKKLWLNFKIIY